MYKNPKDDHRWSRQRGRVPEGLATASAKEPFGLGIYSQGVHQEGPEEDSHFRAIVNSSTVTV